jgi:hypothetical protein
MFEFLKNFYLKFFKKVLYIFLYLYLGMDSS